MIPVTAAFVILAAIVVYETSSRIRMTMSSHSRTNYQPTVGTMVRICDTAFPQVIVQHWNVFRMAGLRLRKIAVPLAVRRVALRQFVVNWLHLFGLRIVGKTSSIAFCHCSAPAEAIWLH